MSAFNKMNFSLMVRVWIGLLITFFLVACHPQMRQFETVSHPDQVWQAQVKELSGLEQFKAEGSLSIQSPQGSEFARFEWNQLGAQTLTLTLRGPLGFGQVKLVQQGEIFTLIDGKGRTYHANSPEALMDQVLGWHLPVGGMTYWLRGVPVPRDLEARKVLAPYGALSELDQLGWEIRYLSHQSMGGLMLPHKIQMKRDQITVTLVIQDFQSAAFSLNQK